MGIGFERCIADTGPLLAGRRSAMLKIFAALATLLAASAAPAATPPPKPPAYKISLAGLNGSGCPPGTVTVLPSSDGTTFTLRYGSPFMAMVGGAAEPTDRRKNCQVALDVRGPRGYTYALVGIDYRGRARLAPGASGSEGISSYFAGDSRTNRQEHSIAGTYRGAWKHRHKAGPLHFKPCGRNVNLNINMEVRVSAGRPSSKALSWMSVSSLNGFRFAWRKC
jgi:hypothetical protein